MSAIVNVVVKRKNEVLEPIKTSQLHEGIEFMKEPELLKYHPLFVHDPKCIDINHHLPNGYKLTEEIPYPNGINFISIDTEGYLIGTVHEPIICNNNVFPQFGDDWLTLGKLSEGSVNPNIKIPIVLELGSFINSNPL